MSNEDRAKWFENFITDVEYARDNPDYEQKILKDVKAQLEYRLLDINQSRT